MNTTPNPSRRTDKRKPFAALLALPLTLTGVYVANHRQAQAQAETGRVADFTLHTTSGATFQLYSLAGKKAAVLFFLGADCPISNLYLPRMQEMAKQYAAKGVAVIGVDANAHETPAHVAQVAKAAGITFPILMDPHQKVADQLQVKRTCEAVLVDGSARLRYQGAVDDQYGFTGRKPAPTTNWLTDALDATLAGKAAPKTRTQPAGCLLDRLEPVKAEGDAKPALLNPPPAYPAEAPLPKVGKVTWAANVAPILQAKCESCHRPGQAGPFALQTYEQARRWTAMIGETVQTRRMPPWHADPTHGDFSNDRSLTPKEKATLLAWVKQGAPQGDLKQAPHPQAFTDGWNIAKPDVVLTVDKPYTVKATGTLPYQWFRVPTNFKEDKWIQSAEVKPSARRAVHHVLVFIDDHKTSRGNGLDGFIAEYVPGESPMVFPDGIAKRVPAGSDLLFQVHYTPTGTEQVDQTSLGFVFSKKPPVSEADTVGILSPIRIPPGDDNYKVERTFEVPVNATAYAYSPHMHVRGKAFRLSATYPDGKAETLLSVPKYDFNWQTRYMLKTPKSLPKGTKLKVEAWFDNSDKNPYNPDPKKLVTWGEQTTDEMMIGYVDYIVEGNKTQMVRFANLLGLNPRDFKKQP